METITRDVPAIVGANLRRLRKDQGHTLERLAELSGVSRAMLGQIETGKSVPTVSLLWKIADALAVPVTTLMAMENAPSARVLRRDDVPDPPLHTAAFARRPLFPLDRPRGTEFYELRIGPHHHEDAEPYPLGARANLVVSSGALVLSLAAEPPITLGEGDAVLFEADAHHGYEAPGDCGAVAYLVVTSAGRRAP